MEYANALRIARSCVDYLAPACERIGIAGSVRREREEVHDIEIVCVPHYECSVDLFGAQNPEREPEVNRLARSLGHAKKDGDKYKQIMLAEGICLDLFIVTPPAQWGVIFVIRTGPGDFSHWLVTPRRQGGAMPAHLRVHDGALWQGSEIVPTPEETDFFAALGLPYVDPRERRAMWNKITDRTP